MVGSESFVMALLEVSGVYKRFGGLQALQDVHLNVPQGSIVGLIGPNGAGKTSFFNVMTGLYPADAGQFIFNGKPYNPKAINEVIQAGIARTFQNIRLFKEMTVLENVMVGRHIRTQSGVWSTIFKTSYQQQEEKKIFDDALRLLAYVGIEKEAQQVSKNLSYGSQRRLEIARALASEPLLLALDEPAAGMNQTEKKDLQVLLNKIRDDGTTILMIEHDVRLVMGICSEITVLDEGRVIAQGVPEVVRKDPAVIQAYLGLGQHD
jgi:branched-chain amino acid transport system ATP-binding protein